LSTCILICTYESNQLLALFTGKQITSLWKNHPPIFFCGVNCRHNSSFLDLRVDSADWLGIIMDAVDELIKKRFESVYVVLDDHPPIGLCEEETLNNILPKALIELEAINISLLGSGYGREMLGEERQLSGITVEALPDSYRWRYSLHPGIWHLESLRDLLSILESESISPKGRSPWDFERICGSDRFLASLPPRNRCFRVTSSLPTAAIGDQILSTLLRGVGRVMRSVAGGFGGSKAWLAVSQRFDFVNHYYPGIYPVFWRGVLVQGAINPELVRFCRFFRKKKLSHQLRVGFSTV